MSLGLVIVSIIWLGVVAYAVFGGADFGSGFWDLVAGGDRRGARPRARIDRSIGPVWEANHVWLIFVLVYLWTAFPEVFAAIATTLFVPILLAGLGIVFRGGAFVFRKSSSTVAEARFFGVLFASSSVVTPVFFGMAVGDVASGRVPLDGSGDPWTSWVNPTSILGGVLAVGTTAWLAAVFLARDSDRDGQADLAEHFRVRALWTGVAIGFVALAGILVIESDAETLAAGLDGRAAPFVVLSALGGLAALELLRRRRYQVARIPAIGAVVAILLGWGLGQYPWMLVDSVEIDEAAASDATLVALLVAFALAGVLAVPALVWLLRLLDLGALGAEGARDDSSVAVLARLTGSASGLGATGDGAAGDGAAGDGARAPGTRSAEPRSS